MDRATPIVASQIAGDFVLPKDKTKKLVFIAGGIGITPFRSMVKYLIDTNEPRTITMLYSARTEADIAYKPVFEAARQAIGLKTIYALTGSKTPLTAPYSYGDSITAELIKEAIPDYGERFYYISGSNAMVVAMRAILTELGVRQRQIKVDFFPGYAPSLPTSPKALELENSSS